MQTHGNTRRRGARRDGLSARYLRLRDQEQLRVADYREPEPPDLWDRVGYGRWDYDWHKPDLDEPQFDSTWLLLHGRLQRAMPLNPLLQAPPRPDPAPRQRMRARAEALEQHLIEHAQCMWKRLEDALSEGQLLYPRVLAGIPKQVDEDLRALARACPERLDLGVALLLFRPFWIRSPASFCPARDGSLVEHLLVRFELPPVLREAWNFEDARNVDLRALVWSVAVGLGCSLRRLARLGAQRGLEDWAPLPKKFPALLARAPAKRGLALAALHAEVHRLGGGEIEFQRLAGNASFRVDPFSLRPPRARFLAGAIRWLRQHREQLSAAQASDVLVWALHLYTEARRHGTPAFSWSGRGFARSVQEAQLYVDVAFRRGWPYNRRRRPELRWRKHGWDWEIESQGARWSFVELASSLELRDEGQAMRHCVGSYDYSCHIGRSAIFSVRVDDQRKLTIELRLPSLALVQVYGKCNRTATRSERELVERWLNSAVQPSP